MQAGQPCLVTSQKDRDVYASKVSELQAMASVSTFIVFWMHWDKRNEYMPPALSSAHYCERTYGQDVDDGSKEKEASWDLSEEGRQILNSRKLSFKFWFEEIIGYVAVGGAFGEHFIIVILGFSAHSLPQFTDSIPNIRSHLSMP